MGNNQTPRKIAFEIVNIPPPAQVSPWAAVWSSLTAMKAGQVMKIPGVNRMTGYNALRPLAGKAGVHLRTMQRAGGPLIVWLEKKAGTAKPGRRPTKIKTIQRRTKKVAVPVAAQPVTNAVDPNHSPSDFASAVAHSQAVEA